MFRRSGYRFADKNMRHAKISRACPDSEGTGHALERQADLEYLDRIEGELGVEAALDVGGPAKAVLLAREQEIADRIAFAPKRLDHGFGLIRRHDRVFIALKEDHGFRQPIHVIKRRALTIALLLPRIRADQPVEIARLEFVSVAGKRGGVADPIVARAALKEVPENQRRQRGVAPGTAAADDTALLVHQPLRDQEFCAVDAVVDIDDAPVQVQALTKGAAEAGAAAVIDVEHRDPAAGPELGGEIERARGRGGRTAVALDQERRPFFGTTEIVRVVWRVEQAECGIAARGRKFHR